AMQFFQLAGKMAISSRLRMLTEKITEAAAKIYTLYNVELHPKSFPGVCVGSAGEGKPITAIAKEIGHSHASVSKIIREMAKKGFVTESKDEADGRRNVVSLSEKGKAATEKIVDQYTDVNSAIEEVLAQTNHDLWKAIEEWEFMLGQ